MVNKLTEKVKKLISYAKIARVLFTFFCWDETNVDDPIYLDFSEFSEIYTIQSGLFNELGSILEVHFPESLISISDNAFIRCIGLTTLEFPNSLESIDNNAFLGCTGLTKVTFGESLTSIGTSSFSGCKGLTTLELPNSLISIGSRAFWSTNITEIVINKPAGSISGAPWGATNATIIWKGDTANEENSDA